MTTAIGVDVGGTRIKVGVVRLAAANRPEVVTRRVLELPTSVCSPAGLVALIGDAVSGLEIAEAPVGIGIAAIVDAERGAVLAAPNLPWLDGAPLGGLIAERTGRAVRIDNDVNCIGWGEARAGAGRGFRDIVCLALGTGLGGAIVADGLLLRGSRGRAGELGHIAVAANGPLCGCGGRGCAEQYASQTGMLRMARGYGLVGDDDGPGAIKGLFERAARGEAGARRVVNEAGAALGLVCAFCCELLGPERIVIAGGIAASLDALLPAARRAMRGHTTAAETPIVRGELGVDAGVVGAALLHL